MKKVMFVLTVFILCSSLVVAQDTESCSLNAELINQDPYPALPGESVKVVFQINGIEDPTCGTVRVSFVERFPFSVDPETAGFIEVNAGTFIRDYESHLLFPVKLRVDGDALEGDNLVDLKILSERSEITETFEVNVEDLRVDFEVSIKDYANKVITFEILNTGEHDVEALTVDIEPQDNMKLIGGTRNIVGSLDSNDDTTFSFEGVPKDGEINLVITYTDEINERRMLSKTLEFNSSNFDRGERGGLSIWFYITVLLVLWMAYSWWKKRNAKKKNPHGHSHGHQ